jgi:hypothetical protein
MLKQLSWHLKILASTSERKNNNPIKIPVRMNNTAEYPFILGVNLNELLFLNFIF